MILTFNFDLANLANRFRAGLNKTDLEKSLIEVGAMLVNDAVTKPLTPRIDTGNLRGSWSIGLAGRLFTKGSAPGQVTPDLNSMSKLELRVGFNMAYAAVMESGKRNGKAIGFGKKSLAATPKTGNHFLETKIKNKAKNYIKFFQDRLS